MNQENKGPEAESNNPEDQQAPETETPENTKRAISEFNETDSVLGEDGEINKAIKVLFDLCSAKNIPMVLGVNYKIEDGEDNFNADIRGANTVGENHFVPPNMKAMELVMKHRELSDMVLHVAENPIQMGMLGLINQMRNNGE